MASINFFSEGIDFSLLHKAAVRKWLKTVIIHEQHSLLVLNYIFCSDQYLLNINSDFLNHPYYTDVITFDYSSSSSSIEGDIFISIDRVRENSLIYNTTFDSELSRVMIHGLLHLLGYNDLSETDTLIIRQKEDFYLSLNFS
jgi:rRNA maturation RNase YbeY